MNVKIVLVYVAQCSTVNTCLTSIGLWVIFFEHIKENVKI